MIVLLLRFFGEEPFPPTEEHRPKEKFLERTSEKRKTFRDVGSSNNIKIMAASVMNAATNQKPRNDYCN
jgi:hypothetical protein